MFIIIIGLVMSIVIIYDVNDDELVTKPTLVPKEQYLYCSDRKIEIKNPSAFVKIYESTNGVPQLSGETRHIDASIKGRLSNSYKYKSFFLPPESIISADKTTSSESEFILIKGEDNMKNFTDKKSYNHIHKGTSNNLTYTSSEFDEYFVIVNSKHNTDLEANFYVTLKTYDTIKLTKQCLPYSNKCHLNSNNNSNFCMIFDYNVSSTNPNVKITIKYDVISEMESDTIIFLVICSIFILLVVILGIRTIVKAVKKSSKTTPELDSEAIIATQDMYDDDDDYFDDEDDDLSIDMTDSTEFSESDSSSPKSSSIATSSDNSAPIMSYSANPKYISSPMGAPTKSSNHSIAQSVPSAPSPSLYK